MARTNKRKPHNVRKDDKTPLSHKAKKTSPKSAERIVKDVLKGSSRYVGEKIHEKFHAAISEAEQENAALEAAHKVEKLGEAAVKKSLRILRRQNPFGKEGKKKQMRMGGHTPTNLSEKKAFSEPSDKKNAGNTPPPATGSDYYLLRFHVDEPSDKAPALPPSSNPNKNASLPPKRKHSSSGRNTENFHSESELDRVLSTSALQFGQSVDFSPKKPGLLGKGLRKGGQIAQRGLQFGRQKAEMKLRGEFEKASGDNAALKAALETEQFAERPVKYVGHKLGNTVKKPVKKAANKVRSAVRHRFLVFKRRFLLKHQSVAQARGMVMKAKAAAKALTRMFMAQAKPVLIALGVCLCIFALLNMVVAPMAAAFTKAGMEYVATTTYPVAGKDITASTDQWTALMTALKERIDNIETEFPGYDEYIYDIEEMPYNPTEIISYLAAMHLEFTHPQVQTELAALFAEQNHLDIQSVTEIRYDSNGDSYTYKKLYITLKPKPFEEIARPRLDSADAGDLYDVFMGSGGNQQALGNPFTFNWQNSISCYYGYRQDPTGAMGGGVEHHTGMDISAPKGTPIRSVQTGVVTISGWHNLYGNYMVISNPGTGITTLYAHCDSLLAPAGKIINQGEIIATVGSTGNSTGNHLHIEVKLNGVRVDPLFYIQAYDE